MMLIVCESFEQNVFLKMSKSFDKLYLCKFACFQPTIHLILLFDWKFLVACINTVINYISIFVLLVLWKAYGEITQDVVMIGSPRRVT